MDISSLKRIVKITILPAFLFASQAVAQETVIFKTPETVVFKTSLSTADLCALDADALEAKITELQNINAKLTDRAEALQVQVTAMKKTGHKKVLVTPANSFSIKKRTPILQPDYTRK